MLPRVPPLLESMAALVLADACMIQRSRVARPLPYENVGVVGDDTLQRPLSLPPRPRPSEDASKRAKTESVADVDP